MICSSLNRLFLTTPPPALAGHRKWRSHISTGLIFGGQVTPSSGTSPHHSKRQHQVVAAFRSQGAALDEHLDRLSSDFPHGTTPEVGDQPFLELAPNRKLR